MRAVFADTSYWIAAIDQDDTRHASAEAASGSIGDTPLLTTEEVLVELLAFFSGLGRPVRSRAVQTVHLLLADPDVEVLHQTHDSFVSGLALYGQRLDKHYSLVDCISMQMMRQRGLTQVLTHDHHFEQEGFVILMR
jgi:predicted nucleic acid-binding protein